MDASLNNSNGSGKTESEDHQRLLFSSWNSATVHLAEFATLPFLFVQLPQIILNTRNLITGHQEALFALQWMGQLTTLLGNLSLLSYFAGRRERGAMAVQTVGVLTTLVVLFQLGIASVMPVMALAATTVTVVFGLVLNFLNYAQLLPASLWKLWEGFITIGGPTVLLQVMWSTFEPYLPRSALPGVVTGVATLSLIALDAFGSLPHKLSDFLVGLSAWTATLLFMWASVAQMWQNFQDPENIKGLSALTLFLAMVGNGLLFPRALFTRDLMWFVGTSWGTLIQGWSLLLTLWISSALSSPAFFGTTLMLAAWFGFVLVRDKRANSLKSTFVPLVEVLTRTRTAFNVTIAEV